VVSGLGLARFCGLSFGFGLSLMVFWSHEQACKALKAKALKAKFKNYYNKCITVYTKKIN